MTKIQHNIDLYDLTTNSFFLNYCLLLRTSDIEVFATVFPQPDYIEANPKQRSEKVLPNKKCLCAGSPAIIGLAEMIDFKAAVKTVTSWKC